MGFALGVWAFGIPGALVGLLIGWWADREFVRHIGPLSMAKSPGGGMPFFVRMQESREGFFEAAFSVMGHLSKADGQVSEREIAAAEGAMRRWGIHGESRQRAIRHFRTGVAAAFDLDGAMDRFLSRCGHSARLKQTLLLMLISAALIDDVLHPNERRILERVASRCGYATERFERLLELVSAQQRFGAWRHDATPQTNSRRLSSAYQALGVEKSASDKEVTRAYRKQMSRYHPDKLMSRGVPESMIQVGKEKTQQVQAAYDLVKQDRGMP